MKQYQKKLLSMQRTSALCIAPAYRRVSTDAALLVSVTIQVELFAKERQRQRIRLQKSANNTAIQLKVGKQTLTQ